MIRSAGPQRKPLQMFSTLANAIHVGPTEGLKGHQAVVKYSSLTYVTWYPHWTLLLGSVLGGNLLELMIPPQTGWVAQYQSALHVIG